VKNRILYPARVEHDVMKFTDGPIIEGLSETMAYLIEKFPGAFIASLDNFGMYVRTSMDGELLAVIQIA
jgi:hypothetical protein